MTLHGRHIKFGYTDCRLWILINILMILFIPEEFISEHIISFSGDEHIWCQMNQLTFYWLIERCQHKLGFLCKVIHFLLICSQQAIALCFTSEDPFNLTILWSKM